MLQPAFDAAHAGLPLPPRDTPLKMLPSHNPPPIQRPARRESERPSMTPRCLDEVLRRHVTDVHAPKPLDAQLAEQEAIIELQADNKLT